MPHYNYPKNSAFFSINIYTWFDFEFIDMSCSDERQIFEENGLCYGVIETADDIKKNGNTNRFIMNCLIFRISLICDTCRRRNTLQRRGKFPVHANFTGNRKVHLRHVDPRRSDVRFRRSNSCSSYECTPLLYNVLVEPARDG